MVYAIKCFTSNNKYDEHPQETHASIVERIMIHYCAANLSKSTSLKRQTDRPSVIDDIMVFHWEIPILTFSASLASLWLPVRISLIINAVTY